MGWGWGGGDADAEGIEFGAGLLGLWGLGMALDEEAELVDGSILLAQREQGEAFAELCRRGFGAAWEAFKNGVVGFNGVREVLDDVLEFTGGNFIVSGVVVADAGLEGFCEWWGESCGGLGRGGVLRV